MKKVLWLVVLLAGVLCMYSCSEEIGFSDERRVQQQDAESSFTGDNVIPGQLVIKLAKEPAEVKIVQTRSGESQVETGVKTIDEICATIGASNMKRVFPPAGKFEARSREAGLHLWYQVEFAEETPLTRAALDFSNSEEIVFVEPVYLLRQPINDATIVADPDPLLQNMQTRNSTSEDPRRGLQWHYENLAKTVGYVSGADINLHYAWEETKGHPDVIVAVVDAGIQHNHPDLADNMWINEGEISNNGRDDDGNGYVDDYHGYNFYDNTGSIVLSDHGTHVAGIIGAVNNNGIGVSGIAGGDKSLNKRGVRLMDCKVAHYQTGYLTAYTTMVAQAIKYGADNGAVISQNSWTSHSTYMQEAVNYFIANAGINEYGNQTGPMKGGIVIAAAGNDDSQSMRYPAALSNVIAVTSIGPDFKRAYYSNYGSWTNIAAPGGNMNLTNGGVYSTLTGGNYGYMQGTSMACPHVSGIAALVLSKAVENGTSSAMTPEILKKILLAACKPTRLYQYNYSYLGEGLIDAALALSIDTSLPPHTPTLVGPDNLVEGEWATFRIDWGGFYPRGGYTFDWNEISFGDVVPSESGMSASVRIFDYGTTYVDVRIKGEYNEYRTSLSKEIRVDQNEDMGSLAITVHNGSAFDMNLTIDNTDINNRFVSKGNIGDFGTQLTPGQYQFTIKCVPVFGGIGDFPIDKASFTNYMTHYGARLIIEVENPGIRVISYGHNWTTEYRGYYVSFFDE